MTVKTPLDIYQEQLSNHKTELSKLNKKGVLFGWLRFLAMGLAFVTSWLAFTNGLFILLIITAILIAIFFYVLTKDLNRVIKKAPPDCLMGLF